MTAKEFETSGSCLFLILIKKLKTSQRKTDPLASIENATCYWTTGTERASQLSSSSYQLPTKTENYWENFQSAINNKYQKKKL